MPIRNTGTKTLLECLRRNRPQGVTPSSFYNIWDQQTSGVIMYNKQCNRLSASLACMIKSGIIKDTMEA